MSISGTVNRVKEENSRESLELQKHSVALGEKNVETLVELNTQMSGLIKATEDMAKKSAFSEKNSRLDGLEQKRKQRGNTTKSNGVVKSTVEAVTNPKRFMGGLIGGIMTKIFSPGSLKGLIGSVLAGGALIAAFSATIKDIFNVENFSIIDAVNNATKKLFGTPLFGKEFTNILKNLGEYIPSLGTIIENFRTKIDEIMTTINTDFPILSTVMKTVGDAIKFLDTKLTDLIGPTGVFEKALASIAGAVLAIKAAKLAFKLVTGDGDIKSTIRKLSGSVDKLKASINSLARKIRNNNVGGGNSGTGNNNNRRNSGGGRQKWWQKLLNKGSLAAVVGTIASVGGFASMMPGFGGDGNADNKNNNNKNNGGRNYPGSTGSQHDRDPANIKTVRKVSMTAAQAEARAKAQSVDPKIKMLAADLFQEPDVKRLSKNGKFNPIDLETGLKKPGPGRIGSSSLLAELATQNPAKPNVRLNKSLLYSLMETEGPTKVAKNPFAKIMLETEVPKVKPTTKPPTLDMIRQALFPGTDRGFTPNNVSNVAPNATYMRNYPGMGRGFAPGNIASSAPNATYMRNYPGMGRGFAPGNVADVAPNATYMRNYPGMGRGFAPNNVANVAPNATYMRNYPGMGRGFAPNNVADSRVSKEIYALGPDKNGDMRWGEKGTNANGKRYAKILPAAKNLEINAGIKSGKGIYGKAAKAAGLIVGVATAPVTGVVLTVAGAALTAYDAFGGAMNELNSLPANSSRGAKTKAVAVGSAIGIGQGFTGFGDFAIEKTGQGLQFLGAQETGEMIKSAAILTQTFDKVVVGLRRASPIVTDAEAAIEARKVNTRLITAQELGISQREMSQAMEKNQILVNAGRVPHPMGIAIESSGGNSVVNNNTNYSGDTVPSVVDASDLAIEVR